MALAYFALVAAVAWRRRRHAGWRGFALAAAVLASLIVARVAAPWEARLVLPMAWLVLGYWIPATIVPAVPDDRIERMLVAADLTLLRLVRGAARTHDSTGDPNRAAAARASRWWLELSYLACYLIVPAAFAFVVRLGRDADLTRFWLMVLLSGYLCYGTLPWTAARPPRLAGTARQSVPGGVARLNAIVLGRVSHQFTTFPSGHVAVSIASALGVLEVSTWSGAVFAALAVSIAVAAVAGRYHYLVDVVLGGVVALLVWVVTGFAA